MAKAKQAPAKKAPAKKAATKKPAAKKPAAKQAPAKKPAARKPVKKLEGKALGAKIQSLIDAAGVRAGDKTIDAAIASIDRARELATTKKLRVRVAAMCQALGNRFLWTQKWKPSLAFYAAGIATLGDGDAPRVLAEMLGECGFCSLQLHDLDAAEQRIRRSLEMHEQAKHLEGVANALYYLSSVIFERGDIEQSVVLSRQAVAKSIQAGDKRGEVYHAYALARSLYERGHTREAEEVARNAIPVASSLGLGAVEGNLVNMVANVALDDHRLDESRKQYERALVLFRQSGLKTHEAITISNIGNLLWDRGLLDESLARYEESLKLHRKSKDQRSLAIGLTARAGVFTEQGVFDKAQTDLEAALAIMIKLGHERRVSFVRSGFARLAEMRGELEEARAHYAEAEMSLESAGDPVEVGRMLYAASGVEAELGDPESAEALIARAAALDPASLSPDSTGHGEKRAGMVAVRALREIAIGRIEAARAKRATGEEARAFRMAAQSRLEVIARAKDSLMDRSTEVRRVMGRLAVQLAPLDSPAQPPRTFAGTCTGTGWKVDKKGKFRGELALATKGGLCVASGFLAWDDRKAKLELGGLAAATTVLRGRMVTEKDPATWHLRVELERTEAELRGRFIEVYKDDHDDEDADATEKEMCTFTWPAM